MEKTTQKVIPSLSRHAVCVGIGREPEGGSGNQTLKGAAARYQVSLNKSTIQREYLEP